MPFPRRLFAVFFCLLLAALALPHGPTTGQAQAAGLIDLFGPSSAPEPTPSRAPKEWTVLVYLCADNNLEVSGILDLLEMEQSVHDDVEVLVLMDRHRGYSQLVGDWTGARLYRVRRGPKMDLLRHNIGFLDAKFPENFSSELLRDYGEIDMSDPATLTRFITDMAARFPAKRYALIPWNHGSGWPGLLQDEDGGSGHPRKGTMNIFEFRDAVKQAAAVLPKKRFDLLLFELCLMGQMDVIDAVRDLADVMVACPPEEPGQGNDYVASLPLFRKDVDTRTLGRELVRVNTEFYRKIARPAAFSAYDLHRWAPVRDAFQGVVRELTRLAPAQFRELTRATRFTLRYESTEDLRRGPASFSTIELSDWLQRLEREVPGAPAGNIAALRAALKDCLIATDHSPGMEKCGGLTVYVPLRRGDTNPAYRHSEFAASTGMHDYFKALYTAQETRGVAAPAFGNIEIGKPVPKSGNKNLRPEDFDIKSTRVIQPFARNVIRFEVTGVGILWTKLYQVQKRGNDRVLHFVDLVVDMNASKAKRQDASSLLDAISPVYNNGSTILMREITGQAFKVTNGETIQTLTIDNTDISASMSKAVGFGTYTDPTLGGRELPVNVIFNTDFRNVQSLIAIEQDGKGNVWPRPLQGREDGMFRPALIVIDSAGKQRKEFGPPMRWGKNGPLLTLGFVEQGAELANMLEAESTEGAKATKFSPLFRVEYGKSQTAMLANTSKNGGNNLMGRYAMTQFATLADGIIEMPAFNTLELKLTPQKEPVWTLDNAGSGGQGGFTWNNYGTPLLTLYQPAERQWMPPKITASWYTFLEGTGDSRAWYFISMGDGTRWGVYPMSRYAQALEGVWKSKTETWRFEGNRVTLTRDGRTGTGEITVKDNRFTATGMPFTNYAFHISADRNKLTIVAREGVVSELAREGAPTAAPKPPAQAPATNALVGVWTGSPQAGLALTVRITPQPPAYFNMNLWRNGVHADVCTFAVRGDTLYASYKDGRREAIRYTCDGTTLALTFPDGETLTLRKQQ